MCGGTSGFASQSPATGGLSPACAGEPTVLGSRTLLGEVYPRVCGGTGQCNPDGIPGHGLSPRVRGNRWRPAGGVVLDRSIPACAGEPGDVLRRAAAAAVYPRVCGGTLSQSTSVSGWTGLSPRVRGNPSGFVATHLPRRSIPACAGEPSGIVRIRCRSEVYPRVCGGTAQAVGAIGGEHGLSPRVRGNRASAIGTVNPYRSIPACAGEPPGRRRYW